PAQPAWTSKSRSGPRWSTSGTGSCRSWTRPRRPSPASATSCARASGRRWTRPDADDRVSAMHAGGPGDSAPDPPELTARTPASVLTTVLLVVIMLAAWAHVLLSPMGMDDMAGMEMAMRPTFADGLAYVTAWSVMITAMM